MYIILLSSIITLFLSYAIIITFPITIERSFSVYMLGYISRYNGKIPLSDINNAVSEYFHNRKLIDKRLKEQTATGSLIYIDDDNIIMTERGKNLVKMNILIGKLFNLDIDNIHPSIKQ